MEKLLGRELDLSRVEDKIIKNFRAVFEYEKVTESEMIVQTAWITGNTLNYETD